MADKKNTSTHKATAALPPVMKKSINDQPTSLYRARKSGADVYVFEAGDVVQCELSAWQYHALNAMFSFGGDAYPSLLANVNERFGLKITQRDLDMLFAMLHERHLLDVAESVRHPLLGAFLEGGAVVREGEKEAQAAAPTPEESKPTDVMEAEAQQVASAKDLFRPTAFFKTMQPLLRQARLVLYPLPFIAFAALFLAMTHATPLMQDVGLALKSFNLFTHLFLGLFTVNALTTLAKASAVYEYGGTVRSIGLKWFFGFLPRLVVKFEDTAKFNRRQKLWVYAAPVLTRIAICSFMTMLWYSTRYMGNALPSFALSVGIISFVSLLISASPFHRGAGYHFLAVFLGEPHLRGKAMKAMFSRFHRGVHQQEDSTAMAVYGMVCMLFVLLFAAASFITLYGWLKLDFGAHAFWIVGALTALFLWRLKSHMQKVNEVYHRNRRFERWRSRTLGDEGMFDQKTSTRKPVSIVTKVALSCAVVMLFFPYNYQPSGPVVLMPVQQQQISTDISGVLAEVMVDGGEIIAEGTVIARLKVDDIESMLDVEKARLEEKQVELKYTSERFTRQTKLLKSGAVSRDAYDKTSRDFSAAKAAIPVIEARIKLYEDQLERSEFVMPFDGVIKTLHLKQQKGRYLEEGDPIAAVEQLSDTYKVEVAIPESDLSYVNVGDKAVIRTRAYPDVSLQGVVKIIDVNVEGETFDRTITMVIEMSSQEYPLKSGMTGFAKTQGLRIPVWKVLTRAISRFVSVDLWAWLP